MPEHVHKQFLPQLLPKSDSRFVKWKESLKKRDCSWCRGLTKETDARVRKISETMRRKKIDNFRGWREKARLAGVIQGSYPEFVKDSKLAFLIGLTLGDGHLHTFPRTEKYEVSLGTDKPKLIDFACKVIVDVFGKAPTVVHPKGVRMVKLMLYQKNISARLGVPLGDRRKAYEPIQPWIWENQEYLLAYLRGLYEAEASLCIHLPTSTYNFSFHNFNESLLKNVEISLKRLGFHPEIRSYAIRLRKKNEVKYFAKLIAFRQYTPLDAGWSNGSLVAL